MTHLRQLPSRRTLLGAVARRDSAWDGLFIVAVRTTGIACRPTCPSRRARPENLEFFPSLSAAEDAGFRACLRCKPEQVEVEPEWWIRLAALADRAGAERLSDKELARHGFDPVRVRRHCLRAHGMTFHRWQRARAVAHAQRQLRRGASLDRVIVTSGWESHSGFRDAFSRAVGAPPGRSRNGEPVFAGTWHSPLGPMVAAAVTEGVVLLEFGDIERLRRQAPTLRRWFQGPVVTAGHPHLDRLFGELEEYFARRRGKFTVPLVVRGSPFEVSVWNALRQIPTGSTCSYADIARTVGNPRAVRAVGSANGRNRLAVVIPCHRVVNTGGKLGGYGGGLWRKVRLLEIEGVTPMALPGLAESASTA
ncbi:MAG TPA: methylated-DNA--[protein]-cysteine S-methyltransferase [Gemmatimonadales bacterium]|jgi:AraC family transcriptional regulator of adaptative response/methylated-DNA-[protein]-cysteine methyltransferase